MVVWMHSFIIGIRIRIAYSREINSHNIHAWFIFSAVPLVSIILSVISHMHFILDFHKFYSIFHFSSSIFHIIHFLLCLSLVRIRMRVFVPSGKHRKEIFTSVDVRPSEWNCSCGHTHTGRRYSAHRGMPERTKMRLLFERAEKCLKNVCSFKQNARDERKKKKHANDVYIESRWFV